MISLEREVSPYRLTVADIAACLAKTPAQVSAVLVRLIQNGYISISGGLAPGRAPHARMLVYPTPLALRTLPAFEAAADEELAGEMDKLRAQTDEWRAREPR